MKKKKFKRRLSLVNVHSWGGVIASVIILILAITGLLLNHQEWFDSKDISVNPYSQNPKVTYIDKTGRLLLSTDHGIFESDDFGSTFEDVYSPYPGKNVIDFIEQNDTLYIAFSNGVIISTPISNWIWSRLDIPEINEIYSLSKYDNQLIMSTDKGLYVQDDEWKIVNKNNTPLSAMAIIKALHTGYYPFSFLKEINSVATIVLIILVVTGVYLFYKRYIRK